MLSKLHAWWTGDQPQTVPRCPHCGQGYVVLCFCDGAQGRKPAPRAREDT